MNRPGPKTFGDWWDAQPGGDYTCTGCGKVGPKAYVQPQHPFWAQGKEGTALCSDCVMRHNRESRERHKAELDAMPRCEVPGCKARGNWKAGTARVLMCGRHLKAAKRAHAKTAGPIWMPAPEPSRDRLLELAQSH